MSDGKVDCDRRKDCKEYWGYHDRLHGCGGGPVSWHAAYLNPGKDSSADNEDEEGYIGHPSFLPPHAAFDTEETQVKP